MKTHQYIYVYEEMVKMIKASSHVGMMNDIDALINAYSQAFNYPLCFHGLAEMALVKRCELLITQYSITE